MPVADYSNMTLSINPTDSITIDMMDRMASTFTEELFDKAEIGDYAKTITINQTGKFTIDFSTVDNINGDITLILLKKMCIRDRSYSAQLLLSLVMYHSRY